MAEIISVKVLPHEAVPLNHVSIRDRHGREKVVQVRTITDDRLRVLFASENVPGLFGPVIEMRLNPEQIPEWEESRKIDIGESKVDDSLLGKVFLSDVPKDVAGRIVHAKVDGRVVHFVFRHKGSVLWETKGRIEQIAFNSGGDCVLVEICTVDSVV